MLDIEYSELKELKQPLKRINQVNNAKIKCVPAKFSRKNSTELIISYSIYIKYAKLIYDIDEAYLQEPLRYYIQGTIQLELFGFNYISIAFMYDTKYKDEYNRDMVVDWFGRYEVDQLFEHKIQGGDKIGYLNSLATHLETYSKYEKISKMVQKEAKKYK